MQVKEVHSEAEAAARSDITQEEKRLSKLKQHVRMARGEIDEMLELIQEIGEARINPARLVHATTELCEGVEESLPDFDVTSLQVGDLEVKVRKMVMTVGEDDGGKVSVEQVPACDVIRVKETRNLKEPSLSFEKFTKATASVAFTSKLPVVDGEKGKAHGLVRLTSQRDHVIAVRPDAVLLLQSSDGRLKQKIEHPLLENARAAVEISQDSLAIACGGKSSEDAKIIVCSMDGQFSSILAEGDFCDLAFAGKKIFALCSEKPKICVFTSNASKKWVITGSIALSPAERSIRDTISTTSISILVGFFKSGDMQEYTLTGESMKALLFPDESINEEKERKPGLILGPTDYAGAVLCLGRKSHVRVLDSHRKWMPVIKFPQKASAFDLFTVTEKGMMVIVNGNQLAAIEFQV